MGLDKGNNLFLNSTLFYTESHHYQPFKNGHIDIRLPMYPDIRLFIFNPVDYPYMWLKYIEGLKREYTRIGARQILDLDALKSPDCLSLAMVAIISGDVVAGVRFHGPIVKADDAFVMGEMEGGNTDLLKEHIVSFLPEGLIEPKGVWIQSKHPARKIFPGLMTRAAVYGALIAGVRYLVFSCPQNMKKVYLELGMHELKDVGCVAYPNDSFKTSCGFFDMQTVFDGANEANGILLRREWSMIHQYRIAVKVDKERLYAPVILDTNNPFHAMSVESMQMDTGYKKISHLADMRDELKSTYQKPEDYTASNNGRWVLYSWRKTALEVLAPAEYRELHTNRNKNKITAAEQKKLSVLRIGIVGLSTGHVIAHTLAMEGLCGHLKLADFDTLETSNLNRIPASLLDIGINKAIITARRIAELNPYMTVDIFDQGIQPENIDRFVDGLDIIIEECDSLDIKLMVREAAAKQAIPVLMSTSDLGMIDVERYDLHKRQKPFHGLVDARAEDMKDLSGQDKAKYSLQIIEGDKISPRLASSMSEIGKTLKTWPQLASDVTQGAAIIAAAVRRIGTGRLTPSGRARVDMDAILRNAKTPCKPKQVKVVSIKKNSSHENSA